jgi:predicted nuclease of restriction endonuclease-like (RecB) superfamily
MLYWDIGRMIRGRQDREGWGAKVVDRLSADLRRAFPNERGFSLRNLKYMRAFAEAWPDRQFVQRVAAQIPWFHNCTLLDKLSTPEDRLWYAGKALENGWSRDVLVLQIDTGLHKRQGKAVTNFTTALPPPQSDLAQQITKDPYLFD